MRDFDVVVVGAGLVGLATALQILRKQPRLRVAIFDKEPHVAAHQSGHNSGVIHSGIYYRPGSLKAQNCVKGVRLMEAFCTEQRIPFERCGKLIVATEEEELPRLEKLHNRGVANGVNGLEMVGPERLREIEPQAIGIKALWSPNTAIVDYIKVAKAYARLIQECGGQIFLGEGVTELCSGGEGWNIGTEKESYKTKVLLNCAGAYSDRIAKMSGEEVKEGQIVPFRGEYYRIGSQKKDTIKGLIYPVPDPRFPFLGVHLSRTIDGNVEAGPNAVLALSREGYRKSDVSIKDMMELAAFPGFWRLSGKYWRMGLGEVYRSFSRSAFLRSLQRLMPSLTDSDLESGGSGVRAQVVLRSGQLHDDFLLKESKRALHVLNAPSPGATASLAIGESLSGGVLKYF